MNHSNDAPAVAIVPYGKWPTWGLAQMPLDALIWPVGRPERLAQGCIGDMKACDHLLTYPRKPLFLLPRFGVKARITVMIMEPDAVHNRYLRWARVLHGRFYKVLTKSSPLLANINNGVFFYFGSTFIENYAAVDRTKSKMASLIASARRDLEGHKLRHEMVDHIRKLGLDVDIMGRGYHPFEHKEDGLAPYRYSVVIENVREKDYFSEKLVDACLCDTVPIYWGAPNISDYFDPRGMIICETPDDIRGALATMSVADYQARLKWIKKNRQTAPIHAEYLKRAANLIRDC